MLRILKRKFVGLTAGEISSRLQYILSIYTLNKCLDSLVFWSLRPCHEVTEKALPGLPEFEYLESGHMNNMIKLFWAAVQKVWVQCNSCLPFHLSVQNAEALSGLKR